MSESHLSMKLRCQERVATWLSNNEHVMNVTGWHWLPPTLYDYAREMEVRIENADLGQFHLRRVPVSCSDEELAGALLELAAFILPEEEFDVLRGYSAGPDAKPKRKPGRPSNAELAAREAK